MKNLHSSGTVSGMNYTCEICTDCIDNSKTEDILQRMTKIVSESLKNAPSGMAVPSGADKNYSNESYHKKAVM